MKPLKILYFIETGGPGGAERVVLELLRGFRDLGHTVSLSTLRTGWLTDTAQAEGFPYYKINSDRRFDVSLPFRLSQLMKMLKADVLHTHLLDSNFYGALASRIAGVKHIGTEHGDVHHLEPKKNLRLKLKVASTSTLTSVSKFSARRLVELGVRAEKVHVIPNPVHPPAPSSEREKVRAEWGIKVEWLWLHVGNLRRVKDQRTLIRGFAESYHSGARAQRLAIIGDGNEREDFERLVDELGLRSVVRLLGHRDDVQTLLPAGDGFILSSVSESMPMALLEAIANGLYPICSSVGGIPEIIPPEQLFVPQDFAALGELCTRTSTNVQNSRFTARELQTKVMREHNLASVLQSYLNLYVG